MAKLSRRNAQDFIAGLVPHPLWRLYHLARHPQSYFWDWRHRRAFPSPGETILHHGEVAVVKSVDADYLEVTLTDGQSASWMHCCSTLPKSK